MSNQDDIDLINRATAIATTLPANRRALAEKAIQLVAGWGWIDAEEFSDDEPHLGDEALAVLNEILSNWQGRRHE